MRLRSIAIPGQSLTQNALYDCERMVFNPWNRLPEHRPLGSVNRIRLAAYFDRGSPAETEHGGS